MSNKIKILMFGPDLKATGGITAVVNNWIDAGLKQFVILKYVSTIDFNGPRQYFLKLRNGINSYFKYIALSSSEYDLVHIHLAHGMSFYRKLVIVLIGKIKRDKIIVHLHGSDFEIFYLNGSIIRKKLITWMFNHVDALIMLSKKWETFAQNICNNKNIYILYNGADPEKFKPQVNTQDKINILFMGELGSRKGTYDLIDAFIPIYNKFNSAYLILGGDGEIEKAKKIIQGKGLEDRVLLRGWLSGEDKINAFKEAHIYVLPSYNEGLPVSILEAMAANLPIVSTPVGGIPEVVIDGVNGFLIQPGDIKSLSMCIDKLCENTELRNEMGKASLKIVDEKYKLVKIVQDLNKLYQDLL